MPHYDPTKPQQKTRVEAPESRPGTDLKFTPIDMSGPVQGPITAPAEIIPAADPLLPEVPATPAENVQKPPKTGKVGRPKGSGSASKNTVPAYKPAKIKRSDGDEDKKRHTSLYLYPSDHKRLRALALDYDFSVTGFAESACLDAMYHSYQCPAPDCNCEFILRTTMKDTAPSCPMCGEKKLHKLYGR